MRSYKKYRQHDERDCGAACLATVFSYFGLKLSLAKCRELVKTDLQGSNIYGLVDGASSAGLKAEAYEGSLEELSDSILKHEFNIPMIAHIITEDMLEHFVVILGFVGKRLKIFDPARGVLFCSAEDFKKHWTGHIVVFKKTKAFKEGNHTQGYYSKYLRLIGKQKLTFIKLIIISLLIVSISLISSLAYQQVIDNIILSDEMYALADEIAEDEVEHHDDEIEGELGGLTKYNFIRDGLIYLSEYMSNIKYLFIGVIGLFLIQAFMQISRGIMLAKISKEFDVSLMKLYVDKIHDLPPSFFHNVRTGELLSRFSDISEIRTAMSNAALALVFDLLSFILGAGLMFIINFKLFLLVMISAVLYLAAALIFKPIIAKINHRVMTSNAKAISDFKECADGIETIKLYCAEKNSRNNLYLDIDKLAGHIFKGEIAYSVQDSLVYLVESLSLILTLWIGSILVLNGDLSLGFLITFSTLIGYVMMPIKEAIEMQPTIQKAFVAAERLNDILESQSEENADIREETSLAGDVVFDNIVFRYGNRMPTLNGIELTVKNGEKLAITGESGCGKTTLAKLLTKVNIHESGTITINNIDIKDIPAELLRKKVAYISQDTFLFSDTIRNNITMWNENISDQQIYDVCTVSMLNDFIEKLPAGLDTRLDEGGTNISGGQKQRIAIARALLIQPDILIMDESTSQLDVKTEQVIHNAIFNKYRDKTCIIIAHRASTIERCDRVVVIENGMIKET